MRLAISIIIAIVTRSERLLKGEPSVKEGRWRVQ